MMNLAQALFTESAHKKGRTNLFVGEKLKKNEIKEDDRAIRITSVSERLHFLL